MLWVESLSFKSIDYFLYNEYIYNQLTIVVH